MIVRDDPDFLRLPPEQAALFAAASESSFFSHPAWYDTMARHAREPNERIRLYIDSDKTEAGLVCRVGGSRGAGRLHGLTNFYSIEHAPILRPGERSGAALAALVGELGAERWSTVTIDTLDRDDPGYEALGDGLHRAGFIIQPFFNTATWYEDTRGLDFRRYLGARPSSLRNTFRRKSNALAAMKMDLRFADDRSALDSLIEDYEAVYRRSWKTSEPFESFMPALIRAAFDLGALRMGVIRIDGVPAAAQFWIVWRGRAVIYKLAHDEGFGNLSLGTVLTMRLAERVLDIDRPDEINFGRGDDDYKRLWLPRRRERWGLFAANPRTARGIVYGARIIAARVRDGLRARFAGASPRP
jgi:hypothetical protein